ncbi:MAG: hypothetical protein ACRCVT_12885 [Leadbetterella sp.]
MMISKRIVGLLLVVTTIVFSCGKTSTSADPEKTLSDKLKLVWGADVVQYGSTQVYKAGAAGNTTDYSKYKLDLSSPPNVTLTEFDGNSFTGKYSVAGSTVSLTGLTPEPTGTGGKIDFTATIDASNVLTLVATQNSPKTGNSKNTYVLKSR